MEKFKEPTEEDLKIYFDHKWTHYTASVLPPRPGFGLFAATLEYKFFEPGTPKNADFIILSTSWLHGTIWMTVTIPTAEKHLAEAVAKVCSVKILDTFPISNKEFPMVATVRMDSYLQMKEVDPNVVPFPLHAAVNHFSLENEDDHPTKLGQMSHDEWNKHEHDLVGKIMGDYEWTEEDEEEMKKFSEFMNIT